MINFILFIVLFGILVFIHEFGHFITAKRLGVGVEKFFLGWGPKIFSVKRGDTEYGISWIPLGGYVKLVGEDISDQKAKEEEQPKNSFMVKPPWARMAIVGAGPISNLILPVILFAALYFVGMPSLAPIIGEVIEGDPASSAGLLQGDKVLKIDNAPIKKWDDLTAIIRDSGGRKLNFNIERDGAVLDLGVTPHLSKVENIFKEKLDGWAIGITPYQFQAAIGVSDMNTPAYLSGLRNGDVIKRVNGKEIKYYWQFAKALADLKGGNADITVVREIDKKKEEREIKIGLKPAWKSPKDLGIYKSELFISSVKPGSIAAEKGMQPGDMIEAIDGEKAYSWIDLERKISDNNGEAVVIGVVRNGKNFKFNITPELTDTKDHITGANEKKRELGIESLVVSMEPPAFEVLDQTYNPFKAVFLGAYRTYDVLKNQTIGFAKLIQGKLSVKNIGGPILIYKLAGRSFQLGGIFSFVSYIALLSIVLGFVNLLPIPILDGGHIFFYFIEMIKRKPLSIRTREIAQNFGLAIILGLLVLASYNDINRYFWRGIVEFFKKIF
jgi:regulator of sigma E protease